VGKLFANYLRIYIQQTPKCSSFAGEVVSGIGEVAFFVEAIEDVVDVVWWDFSI
jgi:glycyl-tRNA synthetase alpha subunit